MVDVGQEVDIAKHGKPSYRLVRINAGALKPALKGSAVPSAKTKQTLADVANILQARA